MTFRLTTLSLIFWCLAGCSSGGGGGGTSCADGGTCPQGMSCNANGVCEAAGGNGGTAAVGGVMNPGGGGSGALAGSGGAFPVGGSPGIGGAGGGGQPGTGGVGTGGVGTGGVGTGGTGGGVAGCQPSARGGQTCQTLTSTDAVCDSCVRSMCCSEVNACSNDPKCIAALDCYLNQCAKQGDPTFQCLSTRCGTCDLENTVLLGGLSCLSSSCSEACVALIPR